MKSYSSGTRGLAEFFRELISLYEFHSRQVPEQVASRIDDVRRVEAHVREHFGKEIRDLDLLEIGPGQFLTQLSYFSAHNRVVGIDRDVIVRGFQPSGYWNMLRSNGLKRTAKTMARKALGVDGRHARELASRLSLRRLPDLTTKTMDVGSMSFPDAQFDFAYSRAVLHHLTPGPGPAIAEIARVLRPGGIAYLSLHPYTSATGCLDPRIYTDRSGEVEGWPHLRPSLRASVLGANAPLNKLRIAGWREIFGSLMPGSQFILTKTTDLRTIALAEELKQAGELADYSVEELVAGEFVALWRKPGAE